MNPVLSEILNTGMNFSPEGKALPLHSHIPQLECEIIQPWIAEYEPSRLFEIGMGYGISSLFICDALAGVRDFTYHIIDLFQSTDWQSIGTFNLNHAEFQDQYTLHKELSEICLPRTLEEGVRLDFALIDGFHTFDRTLVDFFYVNRMLAVGGIIIFDDVQLPSIKKVMAHLATYPCYKTLPLPDQFRKNIEVRVRLMTNSPATRVAGLVKTKDDDRPWNWYHDF